MISKVSKYYQSLINKLSADSKHDDNIFARHSQSKNVITGFGTLVFNVEHPGYFGIIDDSGNQYFPVNCDAFPEVTLDRKRVQFSLRVFKDVPNVYGWGKTVKIIAIQLLN